MSDLIPADELRVTSYPERQKGGQHVGTDYGVKVEHLPTGIVAIVNVGRSQHKHREIAMHMIEAALTHPKWRPHLSPARSPTKGQEPINDQSQTLVPIRLRDAEVAMSRMRSSLDRIKRTPPATEEEIRAMAAKALDQGVILFLRADLQRIPWASREIIETEAARLYGRKTEQ